MPSLRSFGPPLSDGEISAPQSVLRLLQHLLLYLPPSAISLHPSLPSTTPWKKKAQKPCPNHWASSSHHSRHHRSLPLIPQRSGMWSARRFEAQAPQPSLASHRLDLLLWYGSAVASVWQPTRRNARTQSQRTWMRSVFQMLRLLPSSDVEEVNKNRKKCKNQMYKTTVPT